MEINKPNEDWNQPKPNIPYFKNDPIVVLILGIISMFAMYSTDGGEFKYHTKSHIFYKYLVIVKLVCFLNC